MADLSIPKDDYGYYLNFTVLSDDGTAYNLTDYTITLKIWKPGFASVLLVDSACDIVVAASGTCRYKVASGDFPNIDDYLFELELTKTDVQESTIAQTLSVVESG